LPEHLYSALARVARVPLEQGRDGVLPVAIREACAVAGIQRVVLRVPGDLGDFTEFRIPRRSAWPPKELVDGWHDRVLRTARPFWLVAADLPRHRTVSSGIALPVFAAAGVAGSIIAFSTSPDVLSVRQCAALSLLVQAALGRVEATRLRRKSYAFAAAEVHERLARDLHDGPLQMLTAMLLQLRTSRVGDKGDPRRLVSGLTRELRQAVGQMRELIQQLRVPKGIVLEDRVRGALARLENLRGVSCSLRWVAPQEALSPVAADEVFHVINEALANVYRHARAKKVSVVVRRQGGAIEVTVSDDGVGFDVARALRRDVRSLSFGIVSMRERMAQVGGTLVLRSQAGKGTRVRLLVPLDPGFQAGTRQRGISGATKGVA
jgi:signal transduction histidine kinase